ncbi:MAG: hypothetical protein AAFU41_00905 [Pseudomonadota bacterium]
MPVTRKKFEFPGQPDGIDVTLRRPGKAGISYLRYGVSDTVGNPITTAQILTKRQSVIQPDGTYDSLSIVTPPEVGLAVAREDGAITMDMQDVLIPPVGDQVQLDVAKVTGGVTETQQITVPLARGNLTGGSGAGTHYLLPRVGGTGQLIVEPGLNHRKCYYSRAPEALSVADISARHGGATVNQAFFRTTFAKDEFGTDLPYKYGEQEDVKLADDAAELCWKGITRNTTSSNWLLYERGYTGYAYGGGNIDEARGESEIWPLLIGTFGAGAKPQLAFGIPFARQDYMVVDNLECDPGESLQVINVSYLIVSECRMREAITNQGVNFTNEFITFSRVMGYDIVKKPPEEGPTGFYANFNGRHQGHYGKNTEHSLLDECCFDVCGWEEGYDRTGVITGNQPPSQFSHCNYTDSDNLDQTTRGGLLSRGALTGLQGRAGWFTFDVMAMGNNLAFMAGQGGQDGPDPAPYAPGNWSTLLDCGVTWGGYKEQDLDNLERATAIRVQTAMMVMRNNFVMHSGPGNDGTRAWGDQITTGAALIVGQEPGYQRDILVDDTLIYDWGASADANLGGLTPAQLDVATIEEFAKEYTGNPSADRYALIDAIRASDAPWEIARQFLEWMQARISKTHSTRTTGTRVVYQPPASGEAPSRRFEYRYAWSTDDRPGTAPGDTAAIDGHWINHSFQTPYPFAALDLGADGRYTQAGQRLDIGGIEGTGGILTYVAGQVWISGAAPTEHVTLESSGGRIVNTGSLGGQIDVCSRGYGHFLLGLNASDVTIAAGRRLVIKNGFGTHCGWDGDLGQTSTLTINGVLRFEPGLELQYDGQSDLFGTFKEGVQVRGETSGFTATVFRNWHNKNVSGTLYLEDVVGRPADNENLIGIPRRIRVDKPEAVIAQANGDGIATLPTLQKFRSGIYGTAIPNVTANVDISNAEAIEIDLRAMPGQIVAHTLVAADSVSAFPVGAGIIIEGLGARDATVTFSGTTIVLDVSATGSGVINRA